MACAYSQFMKRRLPRVSFRVDSFWSWVLSVVAFFYLVINIGIVHCLGVFFEPWMTKYDVSEATLIWVQSAYHGAYMLFGPLVIGLVKVVPGQILLAVSSVINCVAFIISAYAGFRICGIF